MSKRKKGERAVESCELQDKHIKKLSESFVSPSEKYITSLGNGYIMSYLANKKVKRGFAIISDKRVYFQGSCFTGRGRFLVRADEERTVDVKDVTGSGFFYRRPLGIILLMILVMLLSIGGGAVYIDNCFGDIEYQWNRIKYDKEDIKNPRELKSLLKKCEKTCKKES